ncbi:MAG TPA: UDP-N-acetylmuramate dehydrogenase [Armatimonadetes bacterium]|nr:UDP-N-acetylmuramate dehydrogenase [Armatimonadota bacterium]
MQFPYDLTPLTSSLEGEVRLAEPLSRHTTFKVGGPAEVFVQPVSLRDVQYALAWAQEHRLPWHVLGRGSNVLIREGGVPGVVLRIGPSLGRMQFSPFGVTVQAGASFTALGRRAVQRGLAGLEFAAGVPGTVGGAICLNAGCFGQEIGEVVDTVTVLEPNGEIRRLNRAEMRFAYRHSLLRERNGIVLKAELSLQPADPQALARRWGEILTLKRARQPLDAASAGCVFKNPPGDLAGRLIEAAGCKGLRWGGAQVSEIHANFILNLGGASAADIEALIEIVRERVYHRCDVLLELEIEIWGEKAGIGA